MPPPPPGGGEGGDDGGGAGTWRARGMAQCTGTRRAASSAVMVAALLGAGGALA